MPNHPLTNLKISGIQVQNYRCLKDVSIVFNDPVTVLIGKNAVGKSTVIDVFEFVQDAIVDVTAAIKKRGASINDITWGGQQGIDITLHFSFNVPDDVRSGMLKKTWRPNTIFKKTYAGSSWASVRSEGESASVGRVLLFAATSLRGNTRLGISRKHILLWLRANK